MSNVHSVEVERRWLVQRFNQDVITPNALTSKNIMQGYVDSLHGLNCRVRVVTQHDGKEEGYITFKQGEGLERTELEHPIDPDFAMDVICKMTLRVSKTRFVIGPFELDMLNEPLKGIVLLEREFTPDEVEAGLHLQPVELPEWVEEAVEVTDSLSNLHLARLVQERELAGDTSDIRPLLTRPLPQFVVTGPPGSGKSTMMQWLQHESGIKDRIKVVPEVATIVIGQLGIKPPVGDPLAMQRFQRTLGQVQLLFEAESNRAAVREGKVAVVLDRGLIDSAAYLDGGLEELYKIMGLSLKQLTSPYDGVIVMSAPPRSVYELIRQNNPARSEDYERVKELEGHVIVNWERALMIMSRAGVLVVNENSSWEAKRDSAYQSLLRAMNLG